MSLGELDKDFIEVNKSMFRSIFGCNREDIIDVKLKKGSNHHYEEGVVLFRVKKGDIVDIMTANDPKMFSENITLDPASVWLEDWSDFEINGFKVYNIDLEMECTNLIDHRWKVSYSAHMSGIMGGGAWEYNGDLVSELRDKKLDSIL